MQIPIRNQRSLYNFCRFVHWSLNDSLLENSLATSNMGPHICHVWVTQTQQCQQKLDCRDLEQVFLHFSVLNPHPSTGRQLSRNSNVLCWSYEAGTVFCKRHCQNDSGTEMRCRWRHFKQSESQKSPLTCIWRYFLSAGWRHHRKGWFLVGTPLKWLSGVFSHWPWPGWKEKYSG